MLRFDLPLENTLSGLVGVGWKQKDVSINITSVETVTSITSVTTSTNLI